MVMAGTERSPAPSTDDSLASRLQWLQQRREALQEKLALKNSELKNLCLDEAELTGILPPEIPLEPGESPPAFRRRVGTCLAFPQNLINRLKTNEAEESTLELERQLQVGIANAALGKLNDPAESKAVRRKQRSIYQQSQRRLRELDARLNFIRQAYGRVHLRPHVSTLEPSSHSTGDLTQSQTNAKHRTKKPRPPLDNLDCESGAKTLPARTILQETGISLSPSGAESQLNHGYRQPVWSSREYRMPHDEPGAATIADARNYNHGVVSPTGEGHVDRRRNPKYPDHDYNDNHDLYILPDRYRPRTYSQGTQGSNGGINVCGQKYCQDTERNYRTIPNTYTEEERQMRYLQMQQKRHLETYGSQQPLQILPQHQKPPPHQNYRNYNADQPHNPQLLDNRSPQLTYSQSDEFSNRSNARYRNLPEEPRDSKKNHSQQQQQQQQQQQMQRSRNMREPVPGIRLSKTNLQDCSPQDPAAQLPATGYWMRENDEAVWPEESAHDRFGSLDRRKYNAQCAAYNAGLQAPIHEDRGGPARYSTQQQQQQHSGSSIASSSSSSRDYVLGLTGATKYPSSSAVTSAHHQNYNSQVLQVATTGSPSYEGVTTVPRALVRTQSLGSVETWQQSVVGATSREAHETQQLSPSARRDDCAGRSSRVKEKEWYETWMDSGYAGPLSPGFEDQPPPPPPAGIREITIARHAPPASPQQPQHQHHHHHHPHAARSAAMQPSFAAAAPPPPPPPPPLPSPPSPSYGSKGPPHARGASVADQQQQQQSRIAAAQPRYGQTARQPPPVRHPPSPKSREIPAESKPSAERRQQQQQQQRGDEAMTAGSDRSPDLCTIVQAGKYQPYREVTKPFEMSDFYKYSTKYRKRAEAITQMRNAQLVAGNGDEDDPATARRRHDSASGGGCRDDEANMPLVNPVQRKIYEPVQRMTCQPYGNAAKALGDDGGADWRASTTSRASSEDSTVV